MKLDAAAALRIINNERLRTAQGWGEYRDLGGALALTSDAPIPALNSIGGFTSDERRIEGLLDVGFSLLRAFDCVPTAVLTPLDRPAGLADRLRARQLTPQERSTVMRFAGDTWAIRVNPDVSVKVATADDVRTFAEIHAGGSRWVKKLSLSTTMTAMLDRGNTFYLGVIDGVAAGTLQLLVDGTTAGVYAAATLRAFRRRGVASTLLARAVGDALAQGCDIIALRTAAEGDARRVYEAAGFEPMFETEVWTERR